MIAVVMKFYKGSQNFPFLARGKFYDGVIKFGLPKGEKLPPKGEKICLHPNESKTEKKQHLVSTLI